MNSTRSESSITQKLGAVLFADVVGYSRLMNENELDTYSALKSLLSQLEATCTQYQGDIVEVRGDGILALFETATSAVEFSIELHRIAAQHNQDRPKDQRIKFRAGVHLGEVLLDERGVHGDNVNIAARLQEIAEPERVYISASVYDQIRNRLRYGYEFLGPKQLKNIMAPIPTYCVRSEVEGATMAATLRPDMPLDILDRPDTPSVAVLPFVSTGNDEDDSWIADGLTDDIIMNLSKFRNLFVIARNSSFFFKTESMPPKEAARRLNVRYIARGSVRRSQSRVRITAELIDANTERTIWAERFDRKIDDIFDILDEVTECIVAATAVMIESQEQQRMVQAIPKDLEAYGAVLQGQHHIFKYTRKDNKKAKTCYEFALERDDRYARASAALSRTLNINWRYSWSVDTDTALDHALSYARRAIDLDPTDARGFGELGFVQLYRKEHDAAIESYKRALALNPNDADLHSDYADALAHSGDNETAITHLQQAMRLNPYFPDQYLWHLGGAYFNLKRYGDVIETVNKMNNPTEGQRMLAASYVQLGDTDMARVIADKHRVAHPNFSLVRWADVQPDRWEADTQHFVESLKMAGF
ncbi:adenylate/guanylate cyclase domain-containing protein [Rhodobacteraceae bacterium B1Z28]|uniref:Adenylate/guanylate cyclase domain-containing protein n=1 Tax=Ruegeria haliotis TaxID=2747601 RepID=A0ABX2PSM8_9RHOB|nr:tetratricopeptide repeat protein [Ruegeria haliotis]NVO56744.1 adenylate/guanylate cyclase domain-containing protein [Ruegeria haliotis]